ncbi:MAG: FkbM family methyltransferase [Phycisphaeraceae bacterium]|nr:FkbM family methyltransferase [Phycisphaeraceae bacterium]
MVRIRDVLGDLAPMIDVVDVGAMMLEGQPPFYQPLVDSGLARVVGFEPVIAECEKLNAKAGPNQRHLPYFVGDGSERTFYLTNTAMTSSLYEPNTRLLSRFQALEELTRTVETSRVQTRRLDDMPEITNIDFIKIDVQGAELDVIRGGRARISGAVAVQAEVEFAPMYKDQPLFADVDRELRGMGFALHSFTSMSGRAFKPFADPRNPFKPMRQHLWADVLYVKDFDNLGALTKEQLLKLAIVLHEVYHSWDLANLVLANYDAKAGDFSAWGAPASGLSDRYMAALTPGSLGLKPPVL